MSDSTVLEIVSQYQENEKNYIFDKLMNDIKDEISELGITFSHFISEYNLREPLNPSLEDVALMILILCNPINSDLPKNLIPLTVYIGYNSYNLLTSMTYSEAIHNEEIQEKYNHTKEEIKDNIKTVLFDVSLHGGTPDSKHVYVANTFK
jgi:hypothetical protein